jgi:hypothetical protein
MGEWFRRRTLGLTLIMGLLISGIAFNNCARVVPGGSLASEVLTDSNFFKSSCESDLFKTYAETWHPFLAKTCNRCHDQAWGSRSGNQSWQNFKLKTETAIYSRSTNNFAATNIGEIGNFQNTWDEAKDAFKTCEGGVVVDPQNFIYLAPKVIPGSGTTEVDMSWNVAVEVAKPEDYGKKQAQFNIKVRRLFSSGQLIGFQTRLPTMTKVPAQADFSVDGLGLKVDGVLSPSFTTYTSLAANITGALPVSLELSAGGASAIVPVKNLSGTSAISFILQGVGDPLAPPLTLTDINSMNVTYSDLVGSSPTKGILNQRCLGCHATGGQGATTAGVNMSSFTNTRARSDRIIGSVNRLVGYKPMPYGSAAIPALEIAIIQRWINLGRPQ